VTHMQVLEEEGRVAERQGSMEKMEERKEQERRRPDRQNRTKEMGGIMEKICRENIQTEEIAASVSKFLFCL
jgi:ribonuclease PH